MNVGRLIRTWRGPLTGLLRGWGAPWADATELAQDVLAEAWVARGRFVGDPANPRAMGAWLRGIAIRQFQSWQRRHRRGGQVPLAAEGELALARSGLGGLAVDARAGGTATDADAARTAELLAGVDALPGPERAAVLAHYLEETSVRETAALFGVSEKTIEGRLYRARGRLRERLGERGDVARAARADAGTDRTSGQAGRETDR